MIKKRKTPGKKKVMEFFRLQQQAVSHDMLEAGLNGAMDRVTIYRILKSFEEDGIIHRIMGENGRAYYALCQTCEHEHPHNHQHNHLHFHCTSCDTLSCLEQEIHIPIPAGYQVKNLQLTATGICAKCSL